MSNRNQAGKPQHTATEMVQLMRQGQLTATDTLKTCFQVVRTKEPLVKALSAIDEAQALACAAAIDAGDHCGALIGVPVAVKDVIHVAGFPIGYGAHKIFQATSSEDAACIALLRQAGGIIAAKATTAEFAYSSPATTVNPHNLQHSPGGSSSGSAAAVAAGMFPIAIGTQTGGSMIRPAAFCGVYGFKPTFNIVARDGVKAFAESFDTVGWFAHSLADIQLLLQVLAPTHAELPETIRPPVRVGICKTPYWSQADFETQSLVMKKAQAYNAIAIDMSEQLDRASQDHHLLMAAEMSRSLLAQYKQHGSHLSAGLVALIKRGLTITGMEERAAHNRLARFREDFDTLFENIDVLIAPAAAGPAPSASHHKTGSSIFNRLWSATHAPCLSAPMGYSTNGLPLGLQFIGRRYEDAALIDRVAKLQEII